MLKADDDSLVLLDFEPDVSCENDLSDCDRPIYWRFTKDCCPTVYLLCKECGDSTIRMAAMRNVVFNCKNCGSSGLSGDSFHFDVVT